MAAGCLTDTYEEFVVEHITNCNDGGGETPPAANCWIALWMGNPLDTGAGGAECDYTSYARKQITFSAAASRAVVQNGDLTFPTATGDATSNVDYWAVFTLETAGAMIAHGALDTLRDINSGNTPSIASTEISISVSAGAWHDDLCILVLDWLFRQGTFTQPANLYLGLFKTELADDVTIVAHEFTMTDYEREAIPKGSSYWAAASGDPVATSNVAAVEFGTLTGTGETVTAIALCASGTKTTDDIYMWSNAADQAIATNDSVTFPIGDVDFSAN